MAPVPQQRLVLACCAGYLAFVLQLCLYLPFSPALCPGRLTCAGNCIRKAFSSSGFWLHLARATKWVIKGRRREKVKPSFTQLPLNQVSVAWLFPLSKVSFFPVVLSVQRSSLGCCNHSPCLLRPKGYGGLLLAIGFL